MTLAQRVERFMPAGVPRWVHIYDNGGETADRYTVVFTGRYRHKTAGERWVLAMSGAPYHPQGVCMHVTGAGMVDYPSSGHLGCRITFKALPEPCQRAVLSDYVDLWDLRVKACEGGKA